MTERQREDVRRFRRQFGGQGFRFMARPVDFDGPNGTAVERVVHRAYACRIVSALRSVTRRAL